MTDQSNCPPLPGSLNPPGPWVIGQAVCNGSEVTWTGRVVDVTAEGVEIEIYHPFTGAVFREVRLTADAFEASCEVCATRDALAQRLGELTQIAFARAELERGATVNLGSRLHQSQRQSLAITSRWGWGGGGLITRGCPHSTDTSTFLFHGTQKTPVLEPITLGFRKCPAEETSNTFPSPQTVSLVMHSQYSCTSHSVATEVKCSCCNGPPTRSGPPDITPRLKR